MKLISVASEWLILVQTFYLHRYRAQMLKKTKVEENSPPFSFASFAIQLSLHQ